MERKESSKRTVYKKNFRELLERKQKQKRELRRMKKKIEIQGYINKRGKKTWNENMIGKAKWRKHFKDLDGIELNEEEQRDRMEVRENIRVQE